MIPTRKSTLATRRLIEAAAALEPADRALLNLWVNRRLDDERLAALTGMSAVAVRARRERIIAGLSEQLGEPADAVLSALRTVDPEDDAAPATDSENEGRPDVTATRGGLETPATMSMTGLPQPPPDPNAGPAAPESHVEPEAPRADPEPDPEPASPPPAAAGLSSRRGRVWAALTAGVAIVVAVVLVVLLAGGSSHNARDSPGPPGTATAADSPTTPTVGPTTSPQGAATPPASSTATSSTATTSTTTPTSSGRGDLSGLPGGPAHLSGVVRLVGKIGHLKLRLTVKGLAKARHGYYAAWLFNSVIDSKRLGRVSRDRPNTYRLPRGARRFHFIDVSFQPKGTFEHSGESKLRAINPVDGPKTIIHKARARRPRHLHRATSAHHRRRRAGARHSTRHATRARHRAQSHRATHRRRGKRSRSAKTSK